MIDVTRRIVVVHQSHDYSHVGGGLEEAYYGAEARYNERLAGGRDHIYSLHEATHRLYKHGPPVRYWGSILRVREKAYLLAKAGIDILRARRRAPEAGVLAGSSGDTFEDGEAVARLRVGVDSRYSGSALNGVVSPVLERLGVIEQEKRAP